MSAESLDYAFLKYFGVTAAGEAQFHSFYIPYFADHTRILDLGSGMGGFVKLLCEAGKDAYGVDSDPGCVAASRALDLSIVEADVLDHLRGVEPESLDAIFSAHLVEHLPYEVTVDVIRLAYRALRPGGRLLLVTPNPRAWVSHLEYYHQHFGHVSFYQPELLAFFMDFCGFSQTNVGENPATRPREVAAHSLLARLNRDLTPDLLADPGPLSPQSLLPRPANPLRRLVWWVKMGLLRWLVQPFTDQLAARDRALFGYIARNTESLHLLIQIADCPFECFVVGDKV